MHHERDLQSTTDVSLGKAFKLITSDSTALIRSPASPDVEFLQFQARF
jgi:hypothetical protein